MLEAVSAPLRAYLKGRADTVRQIVTSLTDPEASELLEVDGGEDGAELLQEDVPDEECVDASEARGDEKAMLAWTPDPWQADPGRSSHARRSSDVVATLVDIYGTKALVSECGRSRCRSHAHVASLPPPLSRWHRSNGSSGRARAATRCPAAPGRRCCSAASRAPCSHAPSG